MSRRLLLICIYLHNLVKVRGDAAHTTGQHFRAKQPIKAHGDYGITTPNDCWGTCVNSWKGHTELLFHWPLQFTLSWQTFYEWFLCNYKDFCTVLVLTMSDTRGVSVPCCRFCLNTVYYSGGMVWWVIVYGLFKCQQVPVSQRLLFKISPQHTHFSSFFICHFSDRLWSQLEFNKCICLFKSFFFFFCNVTVNIN